MAGPGYFFFYFFFSSITHTHLFGMMRRGWVLEALGRPILVIASCHGPAITEKKEIPANAQVVKGEVIPRKGKSTPLKSTTHSGGKEENPR